MNADERRFRIDEITEAIIGSAFKVSNSLGCGFLEKVYENALCYELRKQGFAVVQQPSLEVHYEDVIVGNYIADIIVENIVLVELKAVSALDQVHSAQSMNYLHATKITTCLLLNFGNPKVEVKRIVHHF